ncbi:MAG: PorV/PorQ family protein [Bacteroidetes bacterium]|nr:PorV/PorQ family protein [Bacteroidota bacterium]
MIKRIIRISCLILLSLNLFAQAPKYSNEFLSIGIGARALGMSNSNIAIVDDVTSGYWNPSGLNHIKSNIQIGLMHSEYFAGIAKYDYAAIASRIDENSVAGISFIRFGVDDIPNTTELIDAEGNIDYSRITTFSAADYAVLFSYAKTFSNKKLRTGANVKIVHRQVGDFGKAWGFGIDVGAQYDLNKWTFGVMGRDITSTFNAWSFNLSDRMKEVFTLTGNEIPKSSLEITLPKLILSSSRKFNLSENFSILADIDVDITFDGKRNVLIKSNPVSADPHIGAELSFKNFIFLRGGFGNIQNETDIVGKKIKTFQPNIGIGINIKDYFSVDYALTDIGDKSIALYSNVFSLKFSINKKG